MKSDREARQPFEICARLLAHDELEPHDRDATIGVAVGAVSRERVEVRGGHMDEGEEIL